MLQALDNAARETVVEPRYVCKVLLPPRLPRVYEQLPGDARALGGKRTARTTALDEKIGLPLDKDPQARPHDVGVSGEVNRDASFGAELLADVPHEWHRDDGENFRAQPRRAGPRGGDWAVPTAEEGPESLTSTAIRRPASSTTKSTPSSREPVMARTLGCSSQDCSNRRACCSGRFRASRSPVYIVQPDELVKWW